MIMCEECNMWRLVYSPVKLSTQQWQFLQLQFEHYLYTYGSDLANLELTDDFPKVYARELHCGDPIERLYYSAGYAPICIYCAADIPPANASDKPDIQHRSRVTSQIHACTLKGTRVCTH